MEPHRLVRKLLLIGALILFVGVAILTQSKVDAALSLQQESAPVRTVDSYAAARDVVSTSVPVNVPKANDESLSVQSSGVEFSANKETNLAPSVVSEDSNKTQTNTVDTSSSQTSIQTSDRVTVSSDSKPVTGKNTVEQNIAAPVTAVRMMEVSVEPVNKPSSIQTETVSSPEIPSVQVFSEPTQIKGDELEKEKNPKLSGAVTQDYVIKDVRLIIKNDGQKSVLFQGTAKPNSFFNIYIFSKDPIVMTIKADVNGNWSYELTKDLADGQHEVYVAVSEKSGKIISKSQPLAFVKTAQAASVVPISELNENKSPMQRSTASYILIAIVIASVFLLAALVLIGVLTYKYKTDETNVE